MKRRTFYSKIIAVLLVIACVISYSKFDVKADTLYNVTDMSFGTKYSGVLEYGEERYYKISVTKSGIVRYSMSSDISPVNIEVYSSKDLSKCLYKNKTEYDLSQKCYIRNNRSSHIPLLAGVYYIKVSHTNSQCPQYVKFSISTLYISSKEAYTESMSNRYDNRSTAKTIAPNKTYKGMLFYVNDANKDSVDMYKINLKSAKTLKFTVDITRDDGAILYFRIYDSKGNNITKSVSGKSTYSSNDSVGEPFIFNAKLKKGTYYLKVYKNTGSAYKNYGMYNIKYTSK